MLPTVNDITFFPICKGFQASISDLSTENNIIFDLFSQNQNTIRVCPSCGGSIHIYDNHTSDLKDMPIHNGVSQILRVHYHRYRCYNCGNSFTEDIPFRQEGTRITKRAAAWISSLLGLMTIKAISDMTQINWETIRKIHTKEMQRSITEHKENLRKSGYKPTFLAIDEFAIHKGHRYATCVMDLVQGDVLWVGNGRSIEEFRFFFREFDMNYLSEVKAVAIDMNASYNRLIEEYMPWAEIVYDRFHMQAQFGKDVLGAVRLEEARCHQNFAKEIEDSIPFDADKNVKKEMKEAALKERKSYSKLKKARWTILMNGANLSDEGVNSLNEILSSHSNLAVCYAMKEEMTRIFEERDTETARQLWLDWFAAAKSSNISQLVKFAELKERRIDGLVSHAKYPINTGKLEGLNNKIKVAKRVAYGYRNDQYFFTLIRYSTIPSPTKT